MFRGWLIVLAASLLCAGPAQAQSCPVAGQKPMVVVQLFFGESIGSKGRVTKRQWNRFAKDILTPHFSDGFTAYDAEGQWFDAATKRVVREPSKVVIAARDGFKDIRSDVDAVTAAYKARFHQQSVGIVTMQACGAF